MRISDWSSDVCSSDLAILIVAMLAIGLALGWFAGNRGAAAMRAERDARAEDFRKAIIDLAGAERSEARRVGKECVSTCRSWLSPYHYNKTEDQTQKRAT